MHREKLNILRKMMSESRKGQLFPREQGAKCSDSRTGTHPEKGKQVRLRDCSRFSQEPQHSGKPMKMRQIPGQDGSEYTGQHEA